MVYIKNASGVPMDVGTCVYVVGYSKDPVSGNPPAILVDRAQADLPAKMPCVGVVTQRIEPGAIGQMESSGYVSGLNTSNFPINTKVYVGNNGNMIYKQPLAGSSGQLLGVIVDIGSIYLMWYGVDVLTIPHSISHKPNGMDPFIHAAQHRLNGGDEFLHSIQHRIGMRDELSHVNLAGLAEDMHLQYANLTSRGVFTGVSLNFGVRNLTNSGDANYGQLVCSVVSDGRVYVTGKTGKTVYLSNINRLDVSNLPNGATNAGIPSGCLWVTNGHATLPNGVVMRS